MKKKNEAQNKRHVGWKTQARRSDGSNCGWPCASTRAQLRLNVSIELCIQNIAALSRWIRFGPVSIIVLTSQRYCIWQKKLSVTNIFSIHIIAGCFLTQCSNYSSRGERRPNLWLYYSAVSVPTKIDTMGKVNMHSERKLISGLSIA